MNTSDIFWDLLEILYQMDVLMGVTLCKDEDGKFFIEEFDGESYYGNQND